MSNNTISLDQLRKLRLDSHGPNLFVGAGISRDPPTNGPIWTEMQVGFLSAVFDLMESEAWPAASAFPGDRTKVRELNMRPELFWRETLEIVGEEIVSKALSAAGAGSPNQNHAHVAALLESGSCRWVITTNFDEQIESLTESTRVVVPTNMDDLSDSIIPTYIKLHGTIGAGPTLSYTLEHYDALRQRNATLLQGILTGRPLVIAGYSGYDIDVLPVLRDLSENLPWVVIVQHPGSSIEQPVLQLASIHPNCYIVEATCPQALRILSEGIPIPRVEEAKEALPDLDGPNHYARAVAGLDRHLCPLLMSAIFRLSGEWSLARTYAWLTHDAVTDSRYEEQISPQQYQSIHQDLAYCLKLAGDSSGAQIMLNEANTSLEEHGTSLSGFMRQTHSEAITKDAPSQLGGGEAQTRTTLPMFKPSEIIASQLELSEIAGHASKKADFLRRWQLGIARRREKDAGGAIQALDGLMSFALSNKVTHLERGHFLLDYGGAIYDYASEHRHDDLAKKAELVFQGCAKCTLDSGDMPTNARAHRMLAVIYMNSGIFDEAMNHIIMARQTVEKTGDVKLSERIEQTMKMIQELSGNQAE